MAIIKNINSVVVNAFNVGAMPARDAAPQIVLDDVPSSLISQLAYWFTATDVHAAILATDVAAVKIESNHEPIDRRRG